jgi:hypothetical protein
MIRDTWAVHVTAHPVVLTWLVLLVATLWIALRTGSPVVWAACVLVTAMAALMLMVLAHSPAKTIAEIIRDVEAR